MSLDAHGKRDPDHEDSDNVGGSLRLVRCRKMRRAKRYRREGGGV